MLDIMLMIFKFSLLCSILGIFVELLKRLFLSANREAQMSLPIAIVSGCIVLSGSYLYVSTSQQNISEAQQNKEHIRKRKIDCYDILEKESRRYNSVRDLNVSVEYNNAEDACVVTLFETAGQKRSIVKKY